MTYKGVPVMIYGPGDLGRTGIYTNTDLNFSQTFRLPKGMRLTVQFQIINLFDQDFTTRGVHARRGATRWCCRTTRGTLNAGPFFNGFDAAAAQAARFAASGSTLGPPDPRFGMDDSFRGARTARFYVKLQF